MSVLGYVNVSLEILCCIICFILLFCVMATESKKEKLNQVFLSIMCCHIPLMLVDTAIFILEGSAGPFVDFIFRAAYFLSFLLGAILLILFTRYLITFIGIKTTALKKAVFASYIAVAACYANMFFIILTQFNGMYYSIEEGNIFHYSDWYLLSQGLAFICIALNTGIILSHRKNFDTRELIFLLSYTVLPTIALVVQNMVKATIASIDVATTLTIVVFYAGIQSEQAKRLKEKELELIQSRVNVMLSQIQPHFLYNSLTAIMQLCLTDPQMAAKTVSEFSEYLRGNMDSLMLKKPISFEHELHHTEVYLSIEQKRFGEILKIEYDIQTRGFMLPALTLQPMVENAVRHGVTKREEGGTVTISTAQTQSGYTVTIRDDGVGFDMSVPKRDGRVHLGIENVRSRLAAMCGGTLRIFSQPNVGTIVEINIPKRNAAG